MLRLLFHISHLSSLITMVGILRYAWNDSP